MLTENEIERYSRQLILKGWSGSKQECLKQTHVCSPVALKTTALYLAAAGIGKLSLYGEQGQGELITRHLHALNSTVEVSLNSVFRSHIDFQIGFADDSKSVFQSLCGNSFAQQNSLMEITDNCDNFSVQIVKNGQIIKCIKTIKPRHLDWKLLAGTLAALLVVIDSAK